MSDREQLINTLQGLVSEAQNPATLDIDLLDSRQIVELINAEDQKVPAAVRAVLDVVAAAVDTITAALRDGYRLVYVGAGTSGRLGVLDASECPPTFGVDEGRVVALIAGGPDAMFRAQEGAEDDPERGAADLRDIDLEAGDVVVGIAASGRTPYVRGALEYARSTGARTIALACNRGSEIGNAADLAIEVDVGPEALSGSTRMKAGTAQKLVLNMLTTASMIRLGKCYHNLMVDLQASNAKLVARSLRILTEVTGVGVDEAERCLRANGMRVKPALLCLLTGATPEQASAELARHAGSLRRAQQARGQD
jgi:N-acetylmuramic acid 6-phosphate etherase